MKPGPTKEEMDEFRNAYDAWKSVEARWNIMATQMLEGGPGSSDDLHALARELRLALDNFTTRSKPFVR